MTPKISYRVVKNSIKIRIKIQGIPEGLYDTGVWCDKDRFDAKKQICGFPHIQGYMDSTKERILKLFTPGMTPDELWNAYVHKLNMEKSAHLVRDAFAYYLKTGKKGSISTIKNMEAVRSKIELAGIMDKPIAEITGAIVREFVAGLSKYEPSTIYETYMKFKTVLNRYIQENGLDIKLSINGIVKVPKRVESEEPEYLVWEEVQTLLNVELADPKDSYFRDLYCLMCLTGMAVGDLLKFQPEKSVSKDGKWFKYSRKKTGNECTSIPLLPAAKQIIDRNLWPVRISVRTLQYKCDIVSELIGRKVKTHGARKTFGCVFLELGFSMESVSKMLGHSSIAITQKVYAKITKAKIEREMSNLPEAVKQMMGV